MLECHAWLEESGPHDHVLELTYELRTRSRLRVKTVAGEEVGLFLPRGRVLAQGDCLQCLDGSVLMIAAAPEKLSRVVCDDTLKLARAAYHMGNRHVALEVHATELRYQCDHVLDAMLVGFEAGGRSDHRSVQPGEGRVSQPQSQRRDTSRTAAATGRPRP